LLLLKTNYCGKYPLVYIMTIFAAFLMYRTGNVGVCEGVEKC
jgi:hypothetical protein